MQVLLDSALDPVVERTVGAHPERSVEALLELAIVDPRLRVGGTSCSRRRAGLPAASRASRRRARPRPTTTRVPSATVVRTCLYGVDANPLAVEICKVSLWMESIDPGLPLTFLESHVRCGQLTPSARPARSWAGCGAGRRVDGPGGRRPAGHPVDQASQPGGERRSAAPVVRAAPGGGRPARRRARRRGGPPTPTPTPWPRSQREWRALLASDAYAHTRLVADAWCAAFLWPKDKAGPVADAAPTTAAWLALRDGEEPPPPALVETTRRIAEDYGLFHWELAFPDVFARGGFDVVLGNPPWERGEAAGAGVLRPAANPRSRRRGTRPSASS